VLFVGALFPAAAQLPSGASPLVVSGIFAGLLALTTVYVLTAVPRFQAQIAAQRATTRRRRPPAVTGQPHRQMPRRQPKNSPVYIMIGLSPSSPRRRTS